MKNDEKISLERLTKEIDLFCLFVEEGPIHKFTPIIRYLDAEKWAENHPDTVRLFEQCCSECCLRSEQLTPSVFREWYRLFHENNRIKISEKNKRR